MLRICLASMSSKTLIFKRMTSNRILQKYVRVVLLVSALTMVVVYQMSFLFVRNQLDSMELYKGLEIEGNDPLQTCQLPIYHPFENDVLSYFRSPRPISCRSRTPLLTYIDKEGILRYNTTAFSEFGYKISSLNCFYQEIRRVIGNDNEISYGEEKKMTGSDRPETDFVYVACRRVSWLPSVYSMYHAYAQRNSSIRKFRDETEVGAVVVGLDSMSRLNFMRQLPRSYRVITDVLGGIVMKGLNKVGENTFPNLIAMLTGSHPQAKWPKSTFDDWPFLWNALKKDNVATLYGEDCSSIMTFSWWGEGFRVNPTTHYFRTFWIAVDSSSLAAWSSPMCLDSVPKHKIYLNYLQSFLRSYRGHPAFMFSLENEPSHDYLNTVGVMDGDLEEFLLSSFHEGLFNRSILFVLSDHGHRFDDFRKTKQGKVEDRMPMVSVVLPKWYSRMKPHLVKALKINSMRLTSSFDIYSTFLDIFRRESASEDDVTLDSKDDTLHDFLEPNSGISLFRPVPLNRTCKEAGIPEMYCVCVQETRRLGEKEEITQASIDVLRYYINDEILEGSSRTWNETIDAHLSGRGRFDVDSLNLNSLKKCARLTLTVEASEAVTKLDGSRLVHLTFRTHPNDGLFEGRVLWPSGTELRDGKIHEDIIRINRYGSQSNCLDRLLMNLLPLVRSVCLCV